MRFDKNKINRVDASVAKRSVVATGIGKTLWNGSISDFILI